MTYAFERLGWNMTPVHMMRARLEAHEQAFRSIRKALSRGDWTDLERMGTAHRLAQEALDDL